MRILYRPSIGTRTRVKSYFVVAVYVPDTKPTASCSRTSGFDGPTVIGWLPRMISGWGVVPSNGIDARVAEV